MGNYLEWEERPGPDGKVACYAKRPDDVPELVDESTHKKLNEQKWGFVHRSLIKGTASLELSKARQVHAMKIAAFEFDPTEGKHYLLDLTDAEFLDGWKQYQEEQARETGEAEF